MVQHSYPTTIHQQASQHTTSDNGEDSNEEGSALLQQVPDEKVASFKQTSSRPNILDLLSPDLQQEHRREMQRKSLQGWEWPADPVKTALRLVQDAAARVRAGSSYFQTTAMSSAEFSLIFRHRISSNALTRT